MTWRGDARQLATPFAVPARRQPLPPSGIRNTAEFARPVGLARTTVSRVLNGQPGLDPRTIERVQRALAETGFAPNAHAMHLKGKRTATIGICMEDLATPTAVSKLAMLQRVLRARGFASLIEVLPPGAGREVVRHFLSLRVEAVVFIGHFVPEEIEARIAELGANGTPHLVIDHLGLRGANTVSLDRAAGMVAVMEHLLDLGHRSFALLGLSKGPVSRHDRMRGVRAALEARGLDADACTVVPDYLHERRNDFDYGRNLARSVLARAARPTAYVGYNDEIAIGALRALQEAGVRVPRDASVTGFNHQEISRMTVPSVTTIDQNIETTVTTAADWLLGQLGQPLRSRPFVRTIPPRLVVGESTGPARSG